MRYDVLNTIEDFEKICEDYFLIIPPDIDSFDLDICTKWEYNDFDRTLVFYFEDEWNLDSFYDKLVDCPKYEETFDVGDFFEGVDRENLKIVVESKETGLI
jgi:hypothetical protein